MCCLLLQPGDHVRVLNGPHAGERGMVVSVDGPQCVLLPDTRQAELKVFVRDLTEAKDSRTGEPRSRKGTRGLLWCLVDSGPVDCFKTP